MIECDHLILLAFLQVQLLYLTDADRTISVLRGSNDMRTMHIVHVDISLFRRAILMY